MDLARLAALVVVALGVPGGVGLVLHLAPEPVPVRRIAVRSPVTPRRVAEPRVAVKAVARAPARAAVGARAVAVALAPVAQHGGFIAVSPDVAELRAAAPLPEPIEDDVSVLEDAAPPVEASADVPRVERDVMAGEALPSEDEAVEELDPVHHGLRPAGRNSAGFEVFVRVKDDARVVLIPAGAFIMGPARTGPGGEIFRSVSLPAYFIDEREVSFDQLLRYADDAQEEVPQPFGSETRRHPASGVTWAVADAYCRWAGARLPAEEEWELAARGLDGREYPWGDAWPPPAGAANISDESVAAAGMTCCYQPGYDDGFAETAPVGSFPRGASPFGVLDMAGNVVEWTESPWLRGGSAFSHDPQDEVRVTARTHFRPGVVFREVGCRCAQSMP